VPIQVLVYSAAITSVLNDAEDTTIFTLDGRRVEKSIDNLSPGIYICNGKKIIVKP